VVAAVAVVAAEEMERSALRLATEAGALLLVSKVDRTVAAHVPAQQARGKYHTIHMYMFLLFVFLFFHVFVRVFGQSIERLPHHGWLTDGCP
jgi:hypothetical protein